MSLAKTRGKQQKLNRSLTAEATTLAFVWARTISPSNLLACLQKKDFFSKKLQKANISGVH